jgi:NitT/TauT family transport system substrate-binding protein
MVVLVAMACPFATLPGCGRESDKAAENAGPKLKVAYIGLVSEAPIFVAQEKGFFREEGIDVELVKTDWNGLRGGLDRGSFDAAATLLMYLLKPIDQGADIKITGGTHMGCLQVQAGALTEIKNTSDLKGKRIAVSSMDSPPFYFACRALAAAGPNPRRDVTWLVIEPEVMEEALLSGQVDAVANSEPIGSMLLARDKVHTIVDQSTDLPYRDEFCCVAVVSGKLASSNPAAAAKVTRALLKGAKWVGENSSVAVYLAVERKYVASSAELNSRAMSRLRYAPGVSRCRDSVKSAAKDMKLLGLLKGSADSAELARRAWLDLEGVTDDWLKGLQVEKVSL